jgi:hypothetical protein
MMMINRQVIVSSIYVDCYCFLINIQQINQLNFEILLFNFYLIHLEIVMSKPITFVRGFRVPKQTDIDKALGDDASFSNEFKNSFDSLPTPTNELDWLANYREKGQTYSQFLGDCPYLDDNNDKSIEKYIYLTLLDNNDRLSLLNIDRLIDYTQRFFQMKVKLLPLFTNFNWNKTKRTWTCK